jgi:hypothetical protein
VHLLPDFPHNIFRVLSEIGIVILYPANVEISQSVSDRLD